MKSTDIFFQNEWGTFEDCDDAAVFAGALKLFLRELPEPLLPYHLHRWQLLSVESHCVSLLSELVKAAKKMGPYGDDVAKSMQVQNLSNLHL